MKLFLTFLTVICFAFNGQAQFDNAGKTTTVGGNFGVSPSTSGTSIFTPKSTPIPETTSEPLRKEKKIDLTQSNDFIKPEFKIGSGYLKNETPMSEEFKTGKFFGSFISKSKFVKVLCRDHEAVDGDRVSIILNDKVVEANIFLDGEFSVFYVELASGYNNLEFVALNQGTSGPNTAQFSVVDEFDITIMSNIWNLATGAKATMSIFRE